MRDFGHPPCTTKRPAILDRDGAPVGPAQFVQPATNAAATRRLNPRWSRPKTRSRQVIAAVLSPHT
jgi:hypothetical protein